MLFLDLGFHAILVQRSIDRCYGIAEGITFCGWLFGGFDALDATPAFATFGDNLPHFFNGMMFSTVVTVSGFRHGRSDSENSG